jgi:hypothetical protein
MDGVVVAHRSDVNEPKNGVVAHGSAVIEPKDGQDIQDKS